MIFIYQTIGQGVGVVVSGIGIALVDKIGRRPLLITGVLILLICNILIGSLGPKVPNITQTEQGVVIASIILLLSGLKLSFQLNGC
jgi:MFS family permease